MENVHYLIQAARFGESDWRDLPDQDYDSLRAAQLALRWPSPDWEWAWTPGLVFRIVPLVER